MRSTIRILVVGAVVVVVALGIWSGAQAAKGSEGRNPAAFISSLFKSQMSAVSSNSTENEMDPPAVSQTAQAGEDNPQRQQDDDMSAAGSTPEPGDDSMVQHESANMPEAEANGEVTGTVTAITATSITVNGVAYNLAAGSEIDAGLKAGDTVKLEFVTNPDGTVSVREVKSGDQSGSTDDSNSSGMDSSGDHRGGSGSGDDSGGHDDSGGGSGGGGGGSGG